MLTVIKNNILKLLCISLVMHIMVVSHASRVEAGVLGSITKGVGGIYLSLTSPVEWFTRPHIVEEQHITPQMFDSEFQDVVLITWSNHTISDRWKNKPYLNEHNNGIIKLLTFGNPDSLESLNAAYRMGCYVYPYAILSYGYHNNTVSLLSAKLDAPSVLVYGAAWIINIPQKIINKIAYTLNSNTSISIFCLIDIVPNLAMLMLEVPLAMVGTAAGFVISLILNPFDSLCSFLGMFYFLAMSMFTAVWDLGLGLLRLLPFV